MCFSLNPVTLLLKLIYIYIRIRTCNYLFNLTEASVAKKTQKKHRKLEIQRDPKMNARHSEEGEILCVLHLTKRSDTDKKQTN